MRSGVRVGRWTGFVAYINGTMRVQFTSGHVLTQEFHSKPTHELRHILEAIFVLRYDVFMAMKTSIVVFCKRFEEICSLLHLQGER
jgi:hypothetical protein